MNLQVILGNFALILFVLMVITGFLGTFTTFSSFSAETVGMLLNGRAGLAFGTIALHLCGSLCLTWLGFKTVQALTG